jgi:hypothetical protein
VADSLDEIGGYQPREPLSPRAFTRDPLTFFGEALYKCKSEKTLLGDLIGCQACFFHHSTTTSWFVALKTFTTKACSGDDHA